MDLRSTDFQRWEIDARQPPSRAASARRAPVKSAIADTKPAARFRFLTADGQSATPLEQEALLGTSDLVEASFLDRCRLVMGCVGRLRFNTPRGRSYATGFMIAPGLAMTNHHVFPDEQLARGSSIEFGYRYDIAGQIAPTTEFDLVPGEFFVADEDLDFAVVAVSPKSTTGAALADRGYLRLNPESGKAEEADFVTIVQHPDGAPMQIALRENEVIRASQQEEFIWYQADTAHGSSGAPVFNDSFQIAALHSSGRIRRNDKGEFALRSGGWTANLEGLTETEVVWEANVGIRISRICAQLLSLAKASSPEHCRVLETAMKSGDVIASAIAGIKAGIGETEVEEEAAEMPDNIADARRATARLSTLVPTAASGLVIPLQLRISLEAAGAIASAEIAQPSAGLQPAADAGLEREAFKMQIPVIHDGLDERDGFDRKFLELAGGADVPMPVLTAKGRAVAAPLLDGSGPELRYHKFSIWMHKDRRLALFTASNVDWRARRKVVDGKKTDRHTLAGFPPNALLAEQWVSDPRMPPAHQLPDIFYTEDRGAFDKGHLVRRDDVCWGGSFDDIQMANGDTYHVTNCSPQIKPFNQGAEGEENWGDLESHVQAATKKDMEKVVVFAGPIFRKTDRWFGGKDDSGAVRVQIPSRFWKIVVAMGDDGPEAYGFILEQDVRPITEKEFFVTEKWIGAMRRISTIESNLRGWVSLDELMPFDRYGAVHGQQ